VAVTEGEEAPLDEAVQSLLDGDAQELLEECLRQTTTVMQLSSNAADHSNVERLQALVKLSGEGQAVSEAEENAARRLGTIAQAILEAEEPPLERPHRGRARPKSL